MNIKNLLLTSVLCLIISASLSQADDCAQFVEAAQLKGRYVFQNEHYFSMLDNGACTASGKVCVVGEDITPCGTIVQHLDSNGDGTADAVVVFKPYAITSEKTVFIFENHSKN